MKTLILMRHAKALKDSPDFLDHSRTLSDKGKEDAKLMSLALKKEKFIPDLMLSSTSKRTVKTAKIVLEELKLKPEILGLESDLYEASTSDIIHIIRSAPDQKNSMMLIGHNPSFTGMIGLLSNTFIDNLPTSGIAVIQFNIPTWKLTHHQSGKLVWFMHPKLL
ncbi:MAG: SixA phosphatase family protein [Bacteroidia bacterium]